MNRRLTHVRRVIVVGACMVAIMSGAGMAAATEIAGDRDVSEVILVKSSQGKAVVRFGTGPMEVVSVGDRIGRQQAEVTEVVAGRLVLEAVFTGKDGRPNRAQVILKDGEQGGTRYLLRLEEEPRPATRPLMIEPNGPQEGR